jgi:hypothetical protein
MTHLARTIRTYTLIIAVTLLTMELCSFGVLASRSAEADHTSLGQAASSLLSRHPLLDWRGADAKQQSEYLFSPLTQYAFRPNSNFSGLKIGRHGFVLNGDNDPEPFPEKPANLVRIALLGGSSAAGATATGNNKTIAAVLEQLLNQKSDAKQTFQVLNFGMGGNYSYGEVTKLMAEIAYLQPDVIIMLDGFNDAHYANLEHLRAGIDAPLINWADFSYHYFDAMNQLSGEIRPPPMLMTYSYLLVDEILGNRLSMRVRDQRAAIYDALPARALSDRVARDDPEFSSVLETNLEFAAAWAARKDIWLFAYLQPYPWEYKDLSCEQAMDAQLMIGRLGPSMNEQRYAEIMRTAFQGYAKVYRELDESYADSDHVRFHDLRRLFESYPGCVYNDPIHYNDQANLIIARRMYQDLARAGVGGPVSTP